MSDDVNPGDHSVLIVDDTSANRRLYSWILGRAGFRVQTAVDGIDALRQIERRRPSLILLDFMMPHLDGVGFLRQLRSVYGAHRIPVVMLTASSAPDDIDKALEAGASDYITKPVNSRILVTRVKLLIQADQDREQASRSREAESLRQELDEAQRVQQAQLPYVPARWRDWTIVGAVAPSGRVGGDVFDLVYTEDGRLIAVLIDVTGHGTASALVAAETRAELRSLLFNRSLQESVERLNARLARRKTGRFSCIAAVELDGPTARVMNAGLPPVAVIRGSTIVAQIAASGLPIGMFDDSSYDVSSFDTEPGDRVVLISDGITEPFGPIDDVRGALQRLALIPSTPALPDAAALRENILQLTRRAHDVAKSHDVLISHGPASEFGTHAELPMSGFGFGSELIDDATALILDRSSSSRDTLRISPRPESVAHAVQWVLGQRPRWADKSALDNGITEALTNAIFHGALELRSRAREAGDYDTYMREAISLASSDAVRGRDVLLSVLSKSNSFGIRIRWDGAACPQGARLPPPEVAPLRESGMGITIIHALFDHVIWSEDGRCVELWLTNDDP